MTNAKPISTSPNINLLAPGTWMELNLQTLGLLCNEQLQI